MLGKFIVFEGIDGSGKSTQSELLAQRLSELGKEIYLTHEPSDGVVGKMLRQALRGELALSEQVMAALFAADRLEHLTNRENGILAHLANGTQVICDRYYLSTYAYQSVQVSLDWAIALNSQAAIMAKPDVHFYIDIPVEVALERIRQNREHTDIYETKERLEKTKKQYSLAIEALRDTENIVTINGERSIDDIAGEIWQYVSKHLL